MKYSSESAIRSRSRAMSILGLRPVTSNTSSATRGGWIASPNEISGQGWAEEEWTQGCPTAHFGTGVPTRYGGLLRQPAGPIHGAGTEPAGTSHGAIGGAVRSGERAAGEVLMGENQGWGGGLLDSTG